MKSSFKLRIFRLALVWATVLLAPIATMAQTSSVELLGTVTAAQASNGLGFNLDENNEWEWAAAAAAGATYARIQCAWDIVEQQTAPPENKAAATQYVQSPQCVSALTYAAKYGITPIIVAGYGAPYHNILGVTIPAGAAVGATSFTVEFQQGVGGDSLASLIVPYDYFCPMPINPPVKVPVQVCGSFVASRHSTQGSLIRGVRQLDSTHAAITLASALTVPLPADSTIYNINEILYPATETDRATDSSVIAYGNYVSFLAKDMAARGLKGQIEIWNEPPLLADPWDNGCLLYDANLAPPCPALPGSPSSPYSPNYGFVANLQQKPMPEGITLTWNGTSDSGSASVLGPRMLAESGTSLVEPSTVVTKESFHPYGYEPEEMMWTAACLESAAKATTNAGRQLSNCVLPGEPQGPNESYAVYLDDVQKNLNADYGVGHEVTETGYLPPAAGYNVGQARFVIRQYLGMQAEGLTPVNFYKLFDSGALQDPNFSFVEEDGNTSSYTTKPDYDAISGFMADISTINSAPATAYSAQTLPEVVSYSGTYPLSTVHMVGSRLGASANSDAFSVWQRSFTNCTSACDFAWITQASPAAGPVTVSIPSGMKLTQLVNLTSRDAVSYTTSGNSILFMVADDPIEVLVDPISSTATGGSKKPTQMTVGASTVASTYGQQVRLTAVLTPYKSTTNTTDGEGVTFLNGTTQIGTGTLASGVATLSLDTIPAGVNSLVAQYAGDAHFTTSSGYVAVTVARANPTLSIPVVETQTYGVAAFPVVPSTNSPGGISLSVVSGPAHISVGSSTGGTVQLLGIGTVVLGAVQLPTANFNAGVQVTRSFVVNAEPAILVFNGVPVETYGNAPFTVGAKSASHGTVTYRVVSGPATVSGTTVSLTGAGVVVIQASQQASGTYLAATATLTFTVAKATPTLKFKSIPAQTFGVAPFAVTATSVSSGAVSFSIVSGPATVTGNMVTLTGAGTVVIKASQATTTNYNAVSGVTTSFVVNPQKPVLAFETLSPKTFGDQPFLVRAKSKSHGDVVLSIIKGPAAASGVIVTLTGAGTVVIQAQQSANGNYTAATANLSIAVAKLNPQLAIPAIASQAYGTTPFPVAPTSNSPGGISLSVVSGPAHISSGNSKGGTVQLLGVGTVVLGATQLATANYSAATQVTTSFVVTPEVPVLVFNSIAAKKYGNASFPILAKSASHGSVTYSVVSGPATVSGSKVTLTGSGTVVLQANQQANGNYSAGTANITFTVAPAS